MEGRYSLGDGRGWLTFREEGGRVSCAAQLPRDEAGLYKGWLVGPSGRALLGTFIPEGAVLQLKRTLTLDELRRQGAWPPQGAEAELTFRFTGKGERSAGLPQGWSWEPTPRRLMGEPLLARSAGDTGALLRRGKEGFSLAYPYRPGEPFPLTPLFCFARIEELEGRPYLLFPFRPGGRPGGRGG